MRLSRRKLAFAAASLAGSMTLSTPRTVRASPNVAPTLVLASGASGSVPTEATWGRPPRRAARAFQALEREITGLRASFRAATGVPSRLYGRGLVVPSASARAEVAEAFGRLFLARHLALLAPGSNVDELELVTDDLDATPRGDGLDTAPIRTLGYRQLYVTPSGARLRVRGGQVSLRFQNDRLYVIGSEAIPLPRARLELPSPIASDEATAAAGERAIVSSFGAARIVAPPSAPFVLPYVGERGVVALRIVRSVVVDTRGGTLGAAIEPHRFEVFVDASTAEVVGREELLRFETATLALRVPARAPAYGPRIDEPARLADLVVENVSTSTDDLGTFSFSAPAANVIAFPLGARVEVHDADGNDASSSFSVHDADAHVWDASEVENVDAQLSAFVHARHVRDYAKGFAPTLAFLDQPVEVETNVDAKCNAYSDGNVLHFYVKSDKCENTARLADIVYHEYGHSIHGHAVIEGGGQPDGTLSEGVSDYLAATITGDHAFGRGFHLDAEPLRDLDPPNHENRWPDDLVGDLHEDGKVVAQALWDLRKALAAKLGPEAGIAHTDHLYYEGIRRAVDTPSFYLEVVAADDDDGDLENGTPNRCEIDRAFGLHGLHAYAIEADLPSLVSPSDAAYPVRVRLTGIPAECADEAVEGGTLRSRRRGADEIDATTLSPSASQLEGSIPESRSGAALDFAIDVAFRDGTTLTLPANPADPWYQLYVGDVTPIACTDFESDPALSGWTHGFTRGSTSLGSDEWEWGSPHGTPTNGDPESAYEGVGVLGQDLGDLPGSDGRYAKSSTSYALGPRVDTRGFRGVRLQYRRWLEVEDGHYDRATIYANDIPIWQNYDSNQGDASSTDHRDGEWRFHDIDLSPFVADHAVEVRFELESDDTKELGGFTLDDLCIVGVDPAPFEDCGASGCDDRAPRVSGGGCAVGASTPSSTPLYAAASIGLVAVLRRRGARARGLSRRTSRRRRRCRLRRSRRS